MKFFYPYCFLTLLIVFCFNPSVIARKNIRYKFLPQWLPQAQFAGYFVAAKKDIYRKYGLDVEIIKGGPEKSPSIYLKDNSADISTMFLSSAIKLKASSLDVVNIGQMVKKSAHILVTKKSNNIKTPLHFEGKRIGIWGSYLSIQSLSLLKKFGVNAILVPQSGTINIFLRGGLDIVSAMSYNEYHLIINSGIDEDELKTFNFGDYGLNFPEDGIYILKSKYYENPEYSCNFVKASIEGWEYGFNNIEETVDIVMDYMKESYVPTNRTHQIWMIKKMKEIMYMNNEEKISPILDKNEFNNVANELYNLKIIDNKPTYEDFFIDCSSDA